MQIFSVCLTCHFCSFVFIARFFSQQSSKIGTSHSIKPILSRLTHISQYVRQSPAFIYAIFVNPTKKRRDGRYMYFYIMANGVLCCFVYIEFHWLFIYFAFLQIFENDLPYFSSICSWKESWPERFPNSFSSFCSEYSNSADKVLILFHECTVAKFLVPDWRDIDDSAGWSASTTALCQSRLYPPFRD